MWIKEPEYPLGESSNFRLNFLYQSDKIFIMDNHLASSWSWLQRIDTNSSYNFCHIDRHYDLLSNIPSVESQIIANGIELSSCSLNEFQAIRQPLSGGDSVPLFRYDNYILNTQHVYNNIFNKKVFATHRNGTRPDDFINPANGDYQIEDFEIFAQLEYAFETYNENQWIVNLDIDYFFFEAETDYYQHLTDKFIKELCRIIRESMANISVFTIALSPECCGGWDKSYRIARMIANYFNLDFRLRI